MERLPNQGTSMTLPLAGAQWTRWRRHEGQRRPHSEGLPRPGSRL